MPVVGPSTRRRARTAGRACGAILRRLPAPRRVATGRRRCSMHRRAIQRGTRAASAKRRYPAHMLADTAKDRLTALDQRDDCPEYRVPACEIAGPVDGSMTQTGASPDRRSNTPASLATASSPTTSEPGSKAMSARPSAASAASSAIVTRSPGLFSRMSPAPNLRQRGRISRSATSATMAVTRSGAGGDHASTVWPSNLGRSAIDLMHRIGQIRKARFKARGIFRWQVHDHLNAVLAVAAFGNFAAFIEPRHGCAGSMGQCDRQSAMPGGRSMIKRAG